MKVVTTENKLLRDELSDCEKDLEKANNEKNDMIIKKDTEISELKNQLQQSSEKIETMFEKLSILDEFTDTKYFFYKKRKSISSGSRPSMMNNQLVSLISKFENLERENAFLKKELAGDHENGDTFFYEEFSPKLAPKGNLSKFDTSVISPPDRISTANMLRSEVELIESLESGTLLRGYSGSRSKNSESVRARLDLVNGVSDGTFNQTLENSLIKKRKVEKKKKRKNRDKKSKKCVNYCNLV